MTTKTCRRCKEQKQATEFYKSSGHSDGLTHICKPCLRPGTAILTANYRAKNPEKVKAALALWRQNNKERIAAHNKAYKDQHKERLKNLRNGPENLAKTKAAIAANPERFVKYRRLHHLKKFGLTLDGYKALLLAQEYRCAICGLHQSESKWNLSVDHHHASGNVRGLLCRCCNSGIGLFQDDVETMMKAIDYLLIDIEEV